MKFIKFPSHFEARQFMRLIILQARACMHLRTCVSIKKLIACMLLTCAPPLLDLRISRTLVQGIFDSAEKKDYAQNYWRGAIAGFDRSDQRLTQSSCKKSFQEHWRPPSRQNNIKKAAKQLHFSNQLPDKLLSRFRNY